MMATRRAAVVAGALLAAFTAGNSLAQPEPSLARFGLLVAQQSRPSFAVIGAGARPAGMGGAFTALADDASAASFNPAGLALLLRPEVSVVLDGFRRSDDHRAFATFDDELELYGASSSTFSTQGLNFAAFTVPFTAGGRNLCLQLSYHRLIDFDFESRRRFDERLPSGDSVAQVDQRVDQAGDVHTFSLAAAYQVTQRMALGVTLSRWAGDWTFATRTAELEVDGGELSSLRFAQDNRWRGWTWSVGMLLRYPHLNVGAAVRAPFDGDYQVGSALTTSFSSPFPATSRATGTLEWPVSWTVGVAWLPWDTWVLSIDYAEYDWDDFLISGIGEEGPVNFFDLQPVDVSRTRNSGAWRFGSEYTFFPGDSLLAVRGGVFLEPRPQVLTPDDEANTLRGFSAGLGWRKGPFAIDVAYQHATQSTRVLQFVDPEVVALGEVSAQAAGDVESTEQRLFISFLYQLESKKPLAKLFRFLFVGPPADDGGRGDTPETGDGAEP